MKKLISLGLVAGMSFSAAAMSSSAVNGLNSTAATAQVQELMTPEVYKDFLTSLEKSSESWRGKNILDLTADELLKFVKALKGREKVVVPTSKLRMCLNAVGSMFSSCLPMLSVFIVLHLVQKVMNWYDTFSARKNCGNINTLKEPISALEAFDNYLLAIKGQKKAKEQLRKIVLSIVDENKKRLNILKNGTKSEHSAKLGARVIYLIGPSGCGKSYTGEFLAKVFTGKYSKPYVVEASDIDKQSEVSPADQLLGMREKRVGGKKVYEFAPLINQIKATPEMVVLINEYDKMHTPDLDEKLRTAMDQGYLSVNGEKIDCSKVIFIITSNESPVVANGGNQKIDYDKVDDGTGSRTLVKHDKAFLNRVKLVEFENLEKEAYKEIAEIPFVELVERYKSEYGIELNLKDVLDQVAAKVEEINKGARPIYDIVANLNEKILSEVILKNATGETYKDKSFDVFYNKDKNDFSLKEVPSTIKEAPVQLDENTLGLNTKIKLRSCS